MVYLCKQAFNYPAGITALILSLWILQQTCHYQISHVSNSDSASEQLRENKHRLKWMLQSANTLVALFSCIVSSQPRSRWSPLLGDSAVFLKSRQIS